MRPFETRLIIVTYGLGQLIVIRHVCVCVQVCAHARIYVLFFHKLIIINKIVFYTNTIVI